MAKDSGGRGVEHPISTDMALIGDTKAELATKSLPKRTGPNFGYGGGNSPLPTDAREQG